MGTKKFKNSLKAQLDRVRDIFTKSSNHRRLRPASVCILTDPVLPEWQVRAIELMQFETGVDIPLVVINTSPTVTADTIDSEKVHNSIQLKDINRFYHALRRDGAWALLSTEHMLARMFGGEDEPLKHQHPIESVTCLEDAEILRCDPHTDGAWTEYPPEVVNQIADQCDVIYYTGTTLIRGDILTAAPYGVLSFHPADISRFRGLGPELAFYEGRTTSGKTLQQLNETVDGGRVVAFDTVDIRDCNTLWDVWERNDALSIRLLTEGVKNLQNPGFEPMIVTEAELGPMYFMSHLQKPRFAGRILLKNLLGRVRQIGI